MKVITVVEKIEATNELATNKRLEWLLQSPNSQGKVKTRIRKITKNILTLRLHLRALRIGTSSSSILKALKTS